jgi:8-oxo-dGTP pyrophosphatase MutT (NUDIX family)
MLLECAGCFAFLPMKNVRQLCAEGSGWFESPMLAADECRIVQGVVAVIPRGQSLLVIQRAPGVVAPLAYCFPGGGVHPGESEEAALQREVREELGVVIEPRQRLWHSITPWGISLAWWLAALPEDQHPRPNPAEVAAWDWCFHSQIQFLPNLLESNHQFLAAWRRGEILLCLE